MLTSGWSSKQNHGVGIVIPNNINDICCILFDAFPRIRIGTVKIIGIDCFAVKRFIIQFIENIVMICILF